jgi:hypothetical protein
VLTFRKKNWLAYNPTHFAFEASYFIGAPPVTRPLILPNSKLGTLAHPHISPGATRLLSGANESCTVPSERSPVTLDWLRKKGYHV